MKNNTLFLTILILVSTGLPTPGVGGQQSLSSGPCAQENIRALMGSLPSGSRMRTALEKGGRGEGTRYPWMDSMRREGIRRALVQTAFVWRGNPMEVTVSRIVYFSKYDQDCAQISDPQQLSRIRTSGLEAELGKAAEECTLKGHWLGIHVHRTSHGVGTIELLDDECLPHLPYILTPMPETSPSRFHEAVAMNDVAEVASLLRGAVSPAERDGALWVTVAGDDPCMTTTLLGAGANPNLRERDGFTLLMVATRYKAFRNVKVLLAAGADVNAKGNNGETALSIARGEHDDEIIALLREAGARD